MSEKTDPTFTCANDIAHWQCPSCGFKMMSHNITPLPPPCPVCLDCDGPPVTMQTNIPP